MSKGPLRSRLRHAGDRQFMSGQRPSPDRRRPTRSRRLRRSNPAIEIESCRRSTCGNWAPQPSVRLDARKRRQTRLRVQSTRRLVTPHRRTPAAHDAGHMRAAVRKAHDALADARQIPPAGAPMAPRRPRPSPPPVGPGKSRRVTVLRSRRPTGDRGMPPFAPGLARLGAGQFDGLPRQADH